MFKVQNFKTQIQFTQFSFPFYKGRQKPLMSRSTVLKPSLIQFYQHLPDMA